MRLLADSRFSWFITSISDAKANRFDWAPFSDREVAIASIAEVILAIDMAARLAAPVIDDTPFARDA